MTYGSVEEMKADVIKTNGLHNFSCYKGQYGVFLLAFYDETNPVPDFSTCRGFFQEEADAVIVAHKASKSERLKFISYRI